MTDNNFDDIKVLLTTKYKDQYGNKDITEDIKNYIKTNNIDKLNPVKYLSVIYQLTNNNYDDFIMNLNNNSNFIKLLDILSLFVSKLIYNYMFNNKSYSNIISTYKKNKENGIIVIYDNFNKLDLIGLNKLLFLFILLLNKSTIILDNFINLIIDKETTTQTKTNNFDKTKLTTITSEGYITSIKLTNDYNTYTFFIFLLLDYSSDNDSKLLLHVSNKINLYTILLTYYSIFYFKFNNIENTPIINNITNNGLLEQFNLTITIDKNDATKNSSKLELSTGTTFNNNDNVTVVDNNIYKSLMGILYKIIYINYKSNEE